MNTEKLIPKQTRRLFGIIPIPLRSHRRAQRKSQAVQEAQLAEMSRMMTERM